MSGYKLSSSPGTKKKKPSRSERGELIGGREGGKRYRSNQVRSVAIAALVLAVVAIILVGFFGIFNLLRSSENTPCVYKDGDMVFYATCEINFIAPGSANMDLVIEDKTKYCDKHYMVHSESGNTTTITLNDGAFFNCGPYNIAMLNAVGEGITFTVNHDGTCWFVETNTGVILSTLAPTAIPTAAPTPVPTAMPTVTPTAVPTTAIPTAAPTTVAPTAVPTP